MPDWLSSVAKLAAALEGGLDRAKYEVADRLLPPRGVHVRPYRGFGTRDALHVSGRVLRNAPLAPAGAEDSSWANLLATWRRFESDEVPGAKLRARFGHAEVEVAADAEGYFHAELRPTAALPLERAWHDVEVTLLEPRMAEGPVVVQAPVLVPPASASFLVVSDVDDTVVRTEATQLIRMARNLLFGNARTRLPFPGVAAFYRALAEGAGGAAANPLFYVSSSPWNLYDLLIELFEHRGIPVGPLLLRDWGLTPEELLPTRHAGHKLAAITKVLDTYPALPVLLIGDSGQEDPEIYAQVIKEHPKRVMAAYIRNVSEETRAGAVRELALTVAKDGGTLLLLDDTVGAAKHAAENGWIARSALAAIAADEVADKTE
jgi:phosphatidate phosphatase APP1